MTSSTGGAKPWDDVNLWGPHKQFRETLTFEQEDEFDDWLDAAREADLARRRAELDEKYPEIDLDEELPDEVHDEMPEAQADELIDWQDDDAMLRRSRERRAWNEETDEIVSDLVAADAKPFGPRAPLTKAERFKIGFAKRGELTPELQEIRRQADVAMSNEFGYPVTSQWVFRPGDPWVIDADEPIPEGAEDLGYSEELEGRLIRFTTVRLKYRVGEDGKFLGQFAYDDRQAVSHVFVTFGDGPFTANIPTAIANVFDRNTGRMLHGQSQNSRASEEDLAPIRAEHDGGLHIDGNLGRPDPRWIALEPKTPEEAFARIAQRLHQDGMVAEWHHDADHPLHPTNRRIRRMYRFAPVEGWAPDDVADGRRPTEADPESPPTPEELQQQADYRRAQEDSLFETLETAGPPEESWSGIDAEGNPDAAPGEAVTEAASAFFSGRVLLAGIVGVLILGAVLAALFLGGGSDGDSVPASDADAPGGGAASSAEPRAATADGEVPELPPGWEAPPPFTPAEAGTDVPDPTVRRSSGGSLWAWTVWTVSEAEGKRVGAGIVTPQSNIPAGTAFEGEFIITVDCESGPCRYSTVYGTETVELTLNGLVLSAPYNPTDAGCTGSGKFELEVTDLTVINGRLVPDYMRGERSYEQDCPSFTEKQVIEYAGRYMFRGSYADQ